MGADERDGGTVVRGNGGGCSSGVGEREDGTHLIARQLDVTGAGEDNNSPAETKTTTMASMLNTLGNQSLDSGSLGDHSLDTQSLSNQLLGNAAETSLPLSPGKQVYIAVSPSSLETTCPPNRRYVDIAPSPYVLAGSEVVASVGGGVVSEVGGNVVVASVGATSALLEPELILVTAPLQPPANVQVFSQTNHSTQSVKVYKVSLSRDKFNLCVCKIIIICV